jgi:Spy/CpxP family protein refolding chaperone
LVPLSARPLRGLIAFVCGLVAVRERRHFQANPSNVEEITMNHKSVSQLTLSAALIALLSMAVPSAHAQEPSATVPPYGPMMYGPMGPGGMGGPGMMGPGMGGMMGMGPGMGMMGMGGGMGMGSLAMLNLSDEQRAKVNKIHDELQKKNWDTQGKILEESAKLRDLYDADTPDAKKISAVYERIYALKRQTIEASIEAHNKMRAVLTKEQQDQLKTWRRGGMGMGPGGYGPRGMGPGMMYPSR